MMHTPSEAERIFNNHQRGFGLKMKWKTKVGTKQFFLEPKPYLDRLPKEVADLNKHGYDCINVHTSGDILDANEPFLKAFGYSLEEVRGMNAWGLFHPSSFRLVMDKLMAKNEDPYDAIGYRKDRTTLSFTILAKNIEIDSTPCRIAGFKIHD